MKQDPRKMALDSLSRRPRRRRDGGGFEISIESESPAEDMAENYVEESGADEALASGIGANAKRLGAYQGASPDPMTQDQHPSEMPMDEADDNMDRASSMADDLINQGGGLGGLERGIGQNAERLGAPRRRRGY